MSSGVFSFWGKGKYTVRSIIIRCIVIMIGVVITGFGAAAYVMAALGADPVTAFVQGMGVQLHLDFGMAMNIFNIVFFVIILILNRKMINIGTVLYTFTLGTFSQIFIDMLGGMMGPDPGLVIKIVVLVLGTLALGVGLGFYQSAELGCGPSDAFNQTMAKLTKIPLKWERIIFDAVMVLGGFLMGGTVFFGTILGMVGVGPVMAPIITKLGPVVDKWAGTVREPEPAK
ncbi:MULTISPECIES: YczE/YyaS/YitT family protein [Oscillospiraceae]|uniref:YitT family protein n=1 Tax=Lawsonibacter faecis TaxID=2763052 RepID=A0A8J6JLQ6_9FIRM|nr:MULTISPECIES: hypothetical protein [Oscillospiraceae]MBC5736530.1 hypothetical protein [Lawsonibacter faecis]MCQ4866274.1 hypothetical protein [Pseudoflavonifractor phocaeensis]